MNAMQRQKGMTLIEALISIAVFAIFVLLINSIFFNILRATTKQGVLREVRQNGGFAMDIVKKRIQESSYVSGPSNACAAGMSSIEIENTDGTITTLSVVPVGAINRLQAQTGSTIEYLTNETVHIESFIFSCDSGTDQGQYKRNFIEIRLVLSHGNNPASSRRDDDATIVFETGAIPKGF